MLGEDRVDELRDDRVVVADDAREERLAGPELGDQVVAHFVPHRAPGDSPRATAVLRAPSVAGRADHGHSGYYDAVTRPRSFPPAGVRRERPLVFGHRGGAKLGPENTMPAFARGLAAGADGFECDVRRSADGVPVVIHDATLDRTTDGSGPVSEHSVPELAAVDATIRFRPPPDVAGPIPRAGIVPLAEVLQRVSSSAGHRRGQGRQRRAGACGRRCGAPGGGCRPGSASARSTVRSCGRSAPTPPT